MQVSPIKILSAGIMISALLIIQAFTFNPATKEVNLLSAIQSKQISADIKSNGRYNGKSVDLKLTNNTSSPLKIKIPAGTLFHPADEGEQTLIHLEDNFIVLKPKGVYSGNLAGFCTEASDKCPTSGDAMTVSANKNPKFTKFSNYLKGKKISKSVYQDAVWAISDGYSISNIESMDPATSQLRKFMATLTGQKNSWFSSPQNTYADANGNIQQETVVITGQLKFDCRKNAKVMQDIYKENGESVFISKRSMTAQTGKVTYKFTMRVKGWEKGKYYIRIHEEGDEITRYYFTV